MRSLFRIRGRGHGKGRGRGRGVVCEPAASSTVGATVESAAEPPNEADATGNIEVDLSSNLDTVLIEENEMSSVTANANVLAAALGVSASGGSSSSSNGRGRGKASSSVSGPKGRGRGKHASASASSSVDPLGDDIEMDDVPMKKKGIDLAFVERSLGSQAYEAMRDAGFTLTFDARKGAFGSYAASLYAAFSVTGLRSMGMQVPLSSTKLEHELDHVRVVREVYMTHVLPGMESDHFTHSVPLDATLDLDGDGEPSVSPDDW